MPSMFLAVLRNLAGFETGLLPEICDVDPVDRAGDANVGGEEDLGDALFARPCVAGLVSLPWGGMFTARHLSRRSRHR